jgi:RNA polymerase sigma-70 factor (ECF subfamily)
LLAAFHHAIRTGDASRFADLLAGDVAIRHDSGGKVPAAVHVLQGKAKVVRFVQRFLRRMWQPYRWTVTDLNGARGVLLEKENVVVTAITISYDQDALASTIFILRNPDKLASLARGGFGGGRPGLE